MNDFPLLRAYRNILWVLAVLVLFGAVLVFVNMLTGNGYYRGNLGTAVLSALPFLAVAFSIGILAEIITLCLQVETHLYDARKSQAEIVELLRQQLVALNRPSLEYSSTATAIPSIPTPTSPQKTTLFRTAPLQQVGPLDAVIAAETADVFEKPRVQGRVLGKAQQGRKVKLYGRDHVGAWVCGDLIGTKWIQVSQLSINGDVLNLPIITAPPAS